MYSEPSQTPRKELFVKIVTGWKPLTIFAKSSILDIWLRLNTLQTIRSVFRILSNIKDEGFCKDSYCLKAINYFQKTLHLVCLTGFWTHLLFWNFRNLVNFLKLIFLHHWIELPMSKLATFIELYLSCLKTEECKPLLQIIWCCELKNCCGATLCNASNDFELSNLSEEDIKKKLLNLDNSKAAGKDQISEGRCRGINSFVKKYI